MSPSARGAVVSLGIAIALVVLVFALYWPATGYELVWDDPIVLNQQINAFHSGRDVVRPPDDIPQFGVHYYRPTIVASYLLDRALFRDGAVGHRAAQALVGPEVEGFSFGYHFGVLVWHALATVLVFFLGRELLRRPGGEPGALWPPAVAAALFAVHPVHTESVVWMTGRSDTVCCVFLLGALLLHLRGRRGAAAGDGLRGVAVATACALTAALIVFLVPGQDGSWALAGLLTVGLLGLIAAIFWQTRRGAWSSLALYGPASVLLLLAAGSKETTLGFVLLLPLIEIVFAVTQAPERRSAEPAAAEMRADAATGKGKGKRKGRRARPAASAARKKRARDTGPGRLVTMLVAAPTWLPYVVVLVAYLALRQQALSSLVPRSAGPPGIFAALGDLLGSIAWYVREMAWPQFSAFIAGIPGGGLGAVLGLLVAGGAVALFLWLLRRGWRAEAFALAAFFAFCAPSLLIVFKRVSETVLAERYLYIPSVGGLLLLAFMLHRGTAALQRRGVAAPASLVAAAVVVLAVGGAWAYGTRARMPVWSDDEAFWRDAAEKAPGEGLPVMHLGKTLASMAGAEFREAERLRGLLGPAPETPPTEEDLRLADEHQRRAEALEAEAAASYERAWQTYNDNEGRRITCNNLGNLYQGKGGRLLREAQREQGEKRLQAIRDGLTAFDAARVQFVRAVTIFPRYQKAYYNWGNAELRQAELSSLLQDAEEYLRHLQAAFQKLERAVQLDSRYYLAFYQTGSQLRKRGLHAAAAENFDLAAQWARNERERATAEQARADARQRLAGWPEEPAAQAQRMAQLGERRWETGDVVAAIDRYWASLRLDPSLARARAALGTLFLQRVGTHLEQGRVGAALTALRNADRYLRKAVEDAPNDSGILLARGQFLVDVARFTEAREVLRTVASRGTPEQRERARRGVEAAEQIIARMPDGKAARFDDRIALGDRHVADGRPGWAAHAYWQALHVGHDPVTASEKLGAVLLMEGEALADAGDAHGAVESYQAAALDFDRAARLDENRLSARKGAGIAYLESGWPAQALPHLEAAVRLSGADAPDRAALEAMLSRARADADVRLAR